MLRILKCLKERPSQLGKHIAEATDIPTGKIATLIKDLNRMFGSRTVIEPDDSSTYGRLTPFGNRVYDQLRHVVAALHALGMDHDSQFLNIATTNSIMLHLLPGALAAYNLLAREVHPDQHIEVSLAECDYSEMLHGVADGRFHLGIAWMASWAEKKGVKASDPLISDIPYTVMIPHERICRSNLARGRFDSLQELFDGSPKGVLVDALVAEVERSDRRIAALHSDASRELRKIVASANPMNTVWVKRYDDALSLVRSGIVDVAVAPIWFQRRQYVQHSMLMKEAERPFVRNIVFYEPTVRHHTHPLDERGVTLGNQLVAKFKSIVASFCTDLRKDLIDSAPTTVSGKRSQRTKAEEEHKLPPDSAVRWAEEYLQKQRVP